MVWSSTSSLLLSYIIITIISKSIVKVNTLEFKHNFEHIWSNVIHTILFKWVIKLTLSNILMCLFMHFLFELLCELFPLTLNPRPGTRQFTQSYCLIPSWTLPIKGLGYRSHLIQKLKSNIFYDKPKKT